MSGDPPLGKSEPSPESADQDEGEDVDVFVSPRRFGGSTPSAKMTKERVRSGFVPPVEMGNTGAQKSKLSADDESLEIGETFEDLNMPYKRDHSTAVGVHISESQVRAQRRIEVISRISAALSLALTIGGIWISTLQGSESIRTSLKEASKILTSPLAYGMALIGAASLMGLTGFLGAGPLSTTLSGGFSLSAYSSTLLFCYEFGTFVLLPLLLIVLVESGTAILNLKNPSGGQVVAISTSLCLASLVTVCSGLVSRAVTTCALF